MIISATTIFNMEALEPLQKMLVQVRNKILISIMFAYLPIFCKVFSCKFIPFISIL